MKITVTVELDKFDSVNVSEEQARRSGIPAGTSVSRTADVAVGNPLEWSRAINRVVGELGMVVNEAVHAANELHVNR